MLVAQGVGVMSSESVPYKGLDALVDRVQPVFAAAAGVTASRRCCRADAFLLPKLFPVLARVRSHCGGPARVRPSCADVQELRQRTFRALRELLARVS